jgi:hypothetical protein
MPGSKNIDDAIFIGGGNKKQVLPGSVTGSLRTQRNKRLEKKVPFITFS